MENINENKDAIYYCEQDDPFCQYPNCVCNTVKPKQDRKQILSEMMQEDEKSGLYDETIEQAAQEYSKYLDDFSYEDFEAGAKWQQKQMYSEEEARKIWYAGQDYWRTNGESITFEELTSNLIRNKNQKSYSAQQVFELMKQALEVGLQEGLKLIK